MPNFIKKILGSVDTGGIIKDVTDAVDKFVTTKEEKELLKQEMFKIQSEYETKIKELEIQDVSSARDREVQLRNTIGVWVQNLSAAFIIVGFLVLLFTVIYKKEEIANRQLADILLGSLGTVVIQVFQYWFGSSRSSDAKNDIIRKYSEK